MLTSFLDLGAIPSLRVIISSSMPSGRRSAIFLFVTSFLITEQRHFILLTSEKVRKEKTFYKCLFGLLVLMGAYPEIWWQQNVWIRWKLRRITVQSVPWSLDYSLVTVGTAVVRPACYYHLKSLLGTSYVTSTSLPCSATLPCLDEDSLLTHERLYVSEYFIIYVDHKIIDIIRPQQNILFSNFW